MNPGQLAVGQTVSFLGDVLRGRHRILEVGCGKGDVARKLGATGLRITALDVLLQDPSPSTNVTFVERDFLHYDTDPFDAVVFTASLHHIAPLDGAIDRAFRLLVPNGLFVADDFDLDAPNAPTLRWYYDTQELLAAADVFPREKIDAAKEGALARWHAAHSDEPPLHTGVQMRRAVAGRFDLKDVHGAAYLYRHIAKHLPHDARGVAIAQHVYNTERRGIADGSLSAVGLGIVAIKAT